MIELGRRLNYQYPKLGREAVLGASFGSVAEIGVVAAVAIILAWQSPKIIDACGRFTKIVLKHQREKARIPQKVKTKKENLAKKIANKSPGKKR